MKGLDCRLRAMASIRWQDLCTILLTSPAGQRILSGGIAVDLRQVMMRAVLPDAMVVDIGLGWIGFKKMQDVSLPMSDRMPSLSPSLLVKAFSPRRLFGFIRGVVGDVKFLMRTYAPAGVFIKYLEGRLIRSRVIARHSDQAEAFTATAAQLSLSTRWFMDNVSHWLDIFDKYRLSDRPGIEALEIGSWEGLSAFFLLNLLPKARITCVDTWEGADEHKAEDSETGPDALSGSEAAFDRNLSRFQGRVEKFKGTSYQYFKSVPDRQRFDLVYVDGSHHCDDVIVDAVKSFEALKVGGLMIFDDYFWFYYPRVIDNPAAAINAFLRLKAGSYRLVSVSQQLVIEKTADRYAN